MTKPINQLTEEELDELIRKRSEENIPQEPDGYLESFARGVLDGVSLGAAPKMVGAGLAPILKFARPDLFGDQSLGEIYEEARDMMRADTEKSAKENPLTSFAGTLTGSAILPFPVKTLKGSFALGGGYGLTQALAKNDEGEVGQITQDDLINAVPSGLLGGTLGVIGTGVANYFGKSIPKDEEALKTFDYFRNLDIPVTKGEVTGNPNLLRQEEAAIKGRLGERAATDLAQFKDLQTEKFQNAVNKIRNNIGGGEEFISKGSAAGEAIEHLTKNAIDERTQFSKLYQEAKQNIAEFKPEELRDFIKFTADDFENSALSIDNVPKAFSELKSLDNILSKDSVSLNSLEAWRQGLNRAIREVAPGGQEEFALKKVSKQFDGYLDGAIEKALKTGDSSALEKFKEARGLAASWYDKYTSGDKSEFGKKFLEDIVDNARFSREPFSDEMLVNKIFGTSELGFTPQSASVVNELKKILSEEDFSKLKLEAAQKLISPLLDSTPRLDKYNTNLSKFLSSNKTLATSLFKEDEIKELQELGKYGSKIFTREKSILNPSNTADVVLDSLGVGGKFKFVKNLFNKVQLDQEKLRNSLMTKEARSMGPLATGRAFGALNMLNTPKREEEEVINLDKLSDDELDTIIESRSSEETNITALSDDELDKMINERSQQEEMGPPIDNTLKKIAYIESGNNPNARAKTSSASGLFQFIDSTWRDVVNRYGKEYGIELKDKNDPNAQRVMAKRMLEDASENLEAELGREPNEAELYLSHFLGLSGAKKLLKNLKGDKNVVELFPAAAKANPSLFFKQSRARTPQEFYDMIKKKMDTVTIKV